jgi:metallo-beta-lactamase superfamily protein
MMTARFLALPVNQGDAFVIERDHLRAMVDGGNSKRQAAVLLKRLVSDRHLDVVVCTHNDKDHAEGIRGLLESQTFSVAEVWLPGRWTDRLIDLCRYEGEFFRELVQQVGDTDAATLEDFAEEFSDPLTRDGGGTAGDNREEEMPSGEDNELLDAIDRALDEPPWRWWSWSSWPTQSLWADAIHAAERIRAIAIAARNAGCHLRWFDHELFRRGIQVHGGRQLFLLPTNSVEIASRPRRARLSALSYLALSVANRESLVFRSPEDDDAPGVLFTADSDLAFSDRALKVHEGDLVTAPHHGSGNNANAYAVVERLAGDCETLKWIRSDGRFRARPGQQYLARKAQAICTRCRGSSAVEQCIELTGANGTWTALPSVHACHCI